jgi:hypothetical protein
METISIGRCSPENEQVATTVHDVKVKPNDRALPDNRLLLPPCTCGGQAGQLSDVARAADSGSRLLLLIEQ